MHGGGASIAFFSLSELFGKNTRKMILSVGVLAAVVQVLYSMLIMFLHAPDFPDASVFSAEGNIVCYIDRLYYPEALLVNGLFYRCALAYFSSISMSLIGIIIGILLYKANDNRFRVTLIGLVMITGGLLLRYAYPINKRLWSLTFILLIAGIDILILCLLNFLCDRKEKERKNFVESFGHNTILLYVLEESGVFKQMGIVIFSFAFTIFKIEGAFYEQLAQFLIICFSAFFLAHKNIKINI